MSKMLMVELYPYKHLDADTIVSLRGTKVNELMYIGNTPNTWDKYCGEQSKGHQGECEVEFDNFESEPVTTWSSVMRNGLMFLQPHIRTCIELCGDKVFIESYEGLLGELLDELEMKPNVNFIRRLFKKDEVDTLITSTVYKNNQNHCIKILTDSDGVDWFACAVFTGEIVWVLEALIDTIDYIYNKYLSYDKYKAQPIPLIQIHYYEREVEEDTSIGNLSTAKTIDSDLVNDLITLFINASILQTKVDDSVAADLELMKSKYIEIASKHNIDLIEMLQKMISM